MVYASVADQVVGPLIVVTLVAIIGGMWLFSRRQQIVGRLKRIPMTEITIQPEFVEAKVLLTLKSPWRSLGKFQTPSAAIDAAAEYWAKLHDPRNLLKIGVPGGDWEVRPFGQKGRDY